MGMRREGRMGWVLSNGRQGVAEYCGLQAIREDRND